MALLALALVAVVIFSVLVAVLSSKTRSEKKSIASFHQHMGQLSDVVKSEIHIDDTRSEIATALFTSVPSHVKVVGKSNGAKSSGVGKRRGYRAKTGVDGVGPQARLTSASRGSAPTSQTQRNLDDQLSSEQKILLHEVDHPAKILPVPLPDKVKPSAAPRRTRLSSSTRTMGSKVHTEVLHFDDGAVDGSSLASATHIFGGDRNVNTKVLAVASIVALVGLGAIVVVLSSSHTVTPPRSPVVALQHSSQSNSTTATTHARPTPPGPLMPTSADSTGAIYFVNASSITLDIHSSAPSWIEESVAPGSKILWEGVIPSGGSETLILNSSMWIRTGNVGVLTITANGQPVGFTAAPGVYEFTFKQGVKT